MDVVTDANMFQVAMTARALTSTGEERKAAMRRAAEAHRDERFPTLLERRRAQLVDVFARDDGTLIERARRVGLRLRNVIEIALTIEFIARAELVRELLGPPDHIDALGAHPVEQP